MLERPAKVLATTSIVLLLLAAGTRQINPTYDSLESLPSNVDSVEGFELLREGFPAGELAPTDVYVVFPEGANAIEDDQLSTVAAISDELLALDGVASVASPAYPRGSQQDVGPQDVTQAIQSIPPDLREQISNGEGGPPPGGDSGSEQADAIGIYTAALDFLSSDQEVSRIEVTLTANPYGTSAMDEIPSIRDTATSVAVERGLPSSSVLVGGETAENYDTRAANNRDIVVVLPLILLAIMIILGLLLRSVVAALYIGATIILTYFATLGLAILVFTYLLGQGSIGSGVPFFLFVFLNALGVDYSIYLMSRIREEAEEHDLRTATELALSNTGGVITSAGLILAGTFGALMTLPLRDLFQLGFAVAIGVLMDTFITRSLLVPSLVDLLGRWNWWPSEASRESSSSARQPAPADD
ncbi:MAG: MMPL family transporter [Thermomicrobiales bacterium]